MKIEEKRLQNKKTETEFVKDNELVKEYIELEENSGSAAIHRLISLK